MSLLLGEWVCGCIALYIVWVGGWVGGWEKGGTWASSMVVISWKCLVLGMPRQRIP